ncbi:P-loop containing nucleoside triphosphate hydrolase protein [Xylaria arbuscula]|nr:P-loop containing nucleoside triphosphate hydrolase protein [Xylaria arbuscula]
MEHPCPVVGPEFTDELAIIQQHVKFDQTGANDLPEWQSFPELPTARDLNPDWDNREDLERVNSLLPNDWQQPFHDKNTYLETHYRLQREEAIAILRYSVKKYRELPSMADDDETCVYTRVFVQGYLMTRLGPMCRIQFSTERAGKRIRWNQTRRLTTGSLVAVSTAQDGFRSICMPAIVADHQIKDGLDQTPPTIQIFWANTHDAILDPTTELVMLESRSSYFEAVRHCMVGLQHVANSETPLDKYLVSLDQCDLAARYVQENPRMNIGSLVHHIPSEPPNLPQDVRSRRLFEMRESLKEYDILGGIDNQISTYTNLDNSQLSAVHRILTKELSIIQGPPGTGKTFTSVQALQILLDSQQERGKNVVIVAAQTNHAVDQILSKLIDLGFNTVRLGGRTRNEEITHYSLYNLRRRVMPTRSQFVDRDYKALESARKRTITRLEEIVAGVFSDDLIDPQALLEAGIITQKQSESLSDSDGWACASPIDNGDEDSPRPLSQWLGDQQIEAPSIDAKDPDFDTEETDEAADFDAEDYDMDLDDCIVEDDDFRVDGRWVPIKYRWTGANPRKYTETDRVIHKELKRDNLWDISQQYRGAIYQFWQRELLRLRCAEIRNELAANSRICRNLKANKWHRDLRCIRKAEIEIIGCTTTGLCKYRGLIAALKPRTMLIEEAAETKEASILSALYPSLQQLILVGDHQQLAPQCNVPSLDEPPYNIRVSMFERLVKMKMPYTMLNMQRRMHPDLRQVLSPFYPDLRDHPVVQQPDARPRIPGMGQQSFFFHHTWSEGTDENLSKFNVLEAEMIVRFIDYLMLNGVKDSEITVLTFYRGQRKKILGEFRKLKHREPFKNVHTVDSYQGEENDIVILSLVRSNGINGPHKAGFLRDSNRGVVSISRARRGFYIFGNIINLMNACFESRMMWGHVFEVFRQQNRFSYDAGLPITCQNHERTTWINHPDEWIKHHGGCTEPCPDKLECGHDCGLRCHWTQHSRLICQKPCEKVLFCSHGCAVHCGAKCRCPCNAFTGAYPDDEAWEDAGVPDKPEGRSDGRVGRIRGSDNRPRTGRGGFMPGGRSARAAEPQGHSVRLNISLGRNWANFNAQQHDEQRRRERLQTAALAASSPLHPSPCNEQAVPEMVNSIQETFRQVTLNTHGRRNVQKGIMSEQSGTPSPENGQRESVANGKASGWAAHTPDTLSDGSTVHTEDSGYLDAMQPQKRLTGEKSPSLRAAPNGRFVSYALPNSQQFMAKKGIPTRPNDQNVRNLGGLQAAENRAEWEDSSTVCEVRDDDAKGLVEETEGNLIEF